MAHSYYSQKEIDQAVAAYEQAITEGAKDTLAGERIAPGMKSAIWRAAEILNLNPQLVRARLIASGIKSKMFPPEFEILPLPSSDRPLDELIAAKEANFERQRVAREARTLIPVRVAIEGAYGILHMGDPHVDDDGCDWKNLQHHIDLANRTDGLFAANVGDYSNNWIGRLARLHANQSTTASDAVRLVEWLIKSTPWLYLVGGNHDAWSGANDPVRWFTSQAGAQYEMHGMRLGLRSPDGSEIRINARHDFKGSSMWNGAHGMSKAAKFAWQRDHIYVCGHRHSAAYQMLVFQNGAHLAHGIRVGSYKHFDDYADAGDFLPENIPAAVTVINPSPRTEAGRVTTFWDADEGANYLRFLRRPKVRVKAA